MLELILLTTLSAQGTLDLESLSHRLPRDGRGVATAPVEALPERVVAPEGEITLFADFEDIRGDAIVLYLVNRTAEGVRIPNQDGDPYTKLTGQRDDGRWELAQQHQSSWCGNSYFWCPELEPGRFTAWLGSCPLGGQGRLVRWRMHSSLDLVSNAGPGFVALEVIESCKRTPLGLRYATWSEVVAIAMDPNIGEGLDRLRTSAVRRLVDFPDARTVEILRRLLHDENERIRSTACVTLGELGETALPARPDLELLAADTTTVLGKVAAQTLRQVVPWHEVTLKLASTGARASNADFWYCPLPRFGGEPTKSWIEWTAGPVHSVQLLSSRGSADELGRLRVPKSFYESATPSMSCHGDSHQRRIQYGTLLARLGDAWGMVELHDGTRPVELELAPRKALRVRVVDERQTPVVGASVVVKDGDRPIWRIETDRRGVAVFPEVGLELFSSVKSFVALGIPLAEPVEASFDPNAPPLDPIELVLPSVGSLEVRIVDKDGAPDLRDGLLTLLQKRTFTYGDGSRRELDRVVAVERIAAGRAFLPHVAPGQELQAHVLMAPGAMTFTTLAPLARAGEHEVRTVRVP